MFSGKVKADIAGDIKAIKEKLDKVVTKDEFRIYIEATDKRFEDMQKYMDKRFEGMQRYMDRRFNAIMWFMGIGFSALAFFSLFLYNLTNKQLKAMQEQMDKRFEEVTSLILILVKAHEKEIGSEVIDVTLGRKPLEKIAKEIGQDFEEKIKKRRKEEFKEYLKDREILLILKKELEQLDKVA